MSQINRRDFLKLLGTAGAVSASVGLVELLERPKVEFAVLPKNTVIIGPRAGGLLDQFYIMGWKGFWKGKAYGEAIKMSDLDLQDIVRKKLIESAYKCWLSV